jgi:hypothetical protein
VRAAPVPAREARELDEQAVTRARRGGRAREAAASSAAAGYALA